MREEPCPLCGRRVSVFMDARDVLHVDCGSCGKYLITDEAAEDVDAALGPNKYLLSGLTREASEDGTPLLIRSQVLSDIVTAAPRPQPLEAIDNILRYVQRHAKGPHEYVTVTPFDYPLVYAREPEEFSFLLQKTVELGYLENPGSGRYRLTIKGWERLAQIGVRTKRSAQAFVAMWFTPELQPAFEEGIKPALEATGYTPVRVDLVEHNEKICDRIIAEIRKSGLVVADFTNHRPNVYFEAGFAMGLGVPVIWTCREDHIGGAHFDTRQYNHILWKHPQDLREKLINRIEAVVPRRAPQGI